MALSGTLTRNAVGVLGPGRHGDGNGLYLVVDSSGARRWIVRLTIAGRRNARGGPLRTDLGLGSVALVTLGEARDRALECRRLARKGIHPSERSERVRPTFEEVARRVHEERLPTFRNAKHGQQWICALDNILNQVRRDIPHLRNNHRSEAVRAAHGEDGRR
ncbi:protein of unknown function [Jannaschia aquimarina]|nr:protein of unknown function [Jannaschia aquimarina]